MMHLQNRPTGSPRLTLAFVYTICCFCLLLPALYNGYPLVISDSGAYIYNGFDFHIPVDRPITYSIFIAITSFFGFTLWTVLISQALILVYFLRRVSVKILKEHYTHRIFILIVLLLSIFTSAAWHCSHITADIFTAILFLAISDYYLSPLSRRTRIIYFILFWLFLMQHNSNLIIVLAFCVLVRLYALVKGKTWFYRKTLLVFCATLFSFISLSFFNLWSGNSFRPNAGTHVFLMARMAENGILDKFLEEYCPTEHYSLCKYQGNTGDRQWAFMWGEKTHFQDAGGWEPTEKEYYSIIGRSLYRPKYLGLQVYEAIEAGIRQLPQMQLSILPYGRGSSPYNNIQICFPRELKEYRMSLQQTLEFNSLGFLNSMILIFTVLMAVATLWLYKPGTDQNWTFLFVTLAGLVCMNALVTGALSTVIERLQSRVFWLLPFCCILYLVGRIKAGSIKAPRSSEDK